MNRVLLDTHTFLWFIMGNTNLSSIPRSHIEDPVKEKLISVASVWEIGIKASIGKLNLGKPFKQLIPEQIQINGFKLMSIEIKHISTMLEMPFHHRDPFDRILIAQSMNETIPIISRDKVFDAYSVQRIWD